MRATLVLSALLLTGCGAESPSTSSIPVAKNAPLISTPLPSRGFTGEIRTSLPLSSAERSALEKAFEHARQREGQRRAP